MLPAFSTPRGLQGGGPDPAAEQGRSDGGVHLGAELLHLAGMSRDRFHNVHLSSQQLADFTAHGYLLLGATVSATGLQRLRQECMAAWQAQKGAFDPAATWLQNSLLVDVHHRAPTVRDFYFQGPLVDVAEQLIGPNIKAATSQLTFKLRGNTMEFGWHQDNGYGELQPYNAISTLTALDDADEENGCLWVIPGSHQRGQIDVRGRLTVEAKEQGQDVSLEVADSAAIPLPMRAGESLVFHCWTLHRSEGNRSAARDRRVLFLRYADADAVEVYNEHRPRLGRLLRGTTIYPEVEQFEADL